MNIINTTGDILVIKFALLSIITVFVIVMIKLIDFDFVKKDFKIIKDGRKLLSLISKNTDFLYSRGIVGNIRFSQYPSFTYNTKTQEIDSNILYEFDILQPVDEHLCMCNIVSIYDTDSSILKEIVAKSERGVVFLLSEDLDCDSKIDNIKIRYFDLDTLEF